MLATKNKKYNRKWREYEEIKKVRKNEINTVRNIKNLHRRKIEPIFKKLHSKLLHQLQYISWNVIR